MSAGGSRRCASDSDEAAQAAIANTTETLRTGVLLRLDARRLCHRFCSGREAGACKMNRR